MNGSKKWIFWTLGIVAVLGGVGFFIYKRKKNQLASSDKSNSGKGVVNTIVEGAKDVIKDVVGGEAKPVVGTENKKEFDSHTYSRNMLIYIFRFYPQIFTKYFPPIELQPYTAVPIGKINDIEYFQCLDTSSATSQHFIGYKKDNKWIRTSYSMTWGKIILYADSKTEIDQFDYLQKPSTKIFVQATLTPLKKDFYVNNFFKPIDSIRVSFDENKQVWNEEGVEEYCKKMKEIITQNFDKLVADAGGKLSFDGNFEFSSGRNGGNILDSNL
jgi:hypothetical protein